MKRLYSVFLLSSLLLLSNPTPANEAESGSEILAQRGKGVVTQTDFTARADKIPEDIRHATLRDGNRFRDVLTSMLMMAQLAADAREAGFDKTPVIADRMRLAADAELGEAWLEHYVAMQPEADLEALARENYQLNQEKMMLPEKIDVSHILVSTEERTDTEALKLAGSISQQLETSPADFDKLVTKFSEDPSASSNKGRFYKVEKGDMVKPFEEAAFALEEGEISEPVKTMYGYHIIRLDAHIAPAKASFEDVRENLVKRERQKHTDRIKRDYLGNLSALDINMTEDALKEMVRRQFGEDYVDPTG